MSLPLCPQKIVHRRDEDTGLVCRSGTYSNLHKPLPKPSAGSAWLFNHRSREWKCVKVESLPEQDELVSDDAILDVAHWEDDMNEEGAAGGNLSTNGNMVAAVPIATIQDDNYKPESVKKEKIIQADPTKFHRHEVKETDTFQGLCLRYKVTATALRRANHFSGSNLSLAPSVLVIPVDPTNIVKNYQVESTAIASAEAQIHAVIRGVAASHPTTEISGNEAKAYLEMNDWNVNQAIANAREDLDFEAE